MTSVAREIGAERDSTFVRELLGGLVPKFENLELQGSALKLLPSKAENLAAPASLGD